MKNFKFFTLFVAALLASGIMAQESAEVSGKNKMVFTVGGPEERYNQIRVINHTSLPEFKCRVVYLNDDNTVKSLFGEYSLKGYDDNDSNANDLRRGYRIGIQMANDCPIDVTFSIEYKDYPFYDAILIYVTDHSSAYDDTF